MANKTPAQATQKWLDKMTQASQAYKDGIQSVQEHPGDAAIAQQSRMLQNLTQAVTSGKWAAGLKKQTLEQWKQSAAQKGAERLATGAEKAKQKMMNHMTAVAPTLEAIKAKVRSMPKGGLENGMARARAAAELMIAFKQSKG